MKDNIVNKRLIDYSKAYDKANKAKCNIHTGYD